MNEMTEAQTVRLIEWLRTHGHDDADIVDCLESINKGK